MILRRIEEGEEIGGDATGLASENLSGIRPALSILSILNAASQSVSVLGEEPALSAEGYCLVDFDPSEQAITLTQVSAEEALAIYAEKEGDPKNNGHNFVLLRASSVERLKVLYPNYFGDISQFVNMFKLLIENNLDIFAQ